MYAEVFAIAMSDLLNTANILKTNVTTFFTLSNHFLKQKKRDGFGVHNFVKRIWVCLLISMLYAFELAKTHSEVPCS